jgi:Fe2+ or Zn2+ uptake regulation protein
VKRASGKRAAKRGAPRARRGAKRQAVLGVVQQHPDGLTRGEILNLMGVKGNKSGEQSVSNALMALTKQNQLDRREGKYVPA